MDEKFRQGGTSIHYLEERLQEWKTQRTIHKEEL